MRTDYGELELAGPGEPLAWCLTADLSGFGIQHVPGTAAQAKPLVAGVADGWSVGAVRVRIGDTVVDVVPVETFERTQAIGPGAPRMVTAEHVRAALRDPAYRAQLRSWLGC
jgi:hypothetical protein